ncbi:class I SAM-dependent methyltransferase [Novosphingobium resinovorum]|uniref:class I SAM-dependent methyltransferase n=1 Tax=Novosphingobium TaxID=165696 RepID=UPI001B3C7202|nr:MULTISPECIES: class I SAM-dependent methyltransferase [Novosphingobium]MBF7011198.1 class I SAM-dependent methyltransferase [Novosphingobium sp. HR1a]WJM29185.1 class I SAM-dependent methyltransferase [Novosphingobium resinovorum]
MFRAHTLFPAVLVPALLSLAACQQPAVDDGREKGAPKFPKPDRPVAQSTSSTFSTEAQRDSAGEANTVMDLAGVAPGMSVADLGAGEGYYTVRLSHRVGKKGRVLGEDIDRGANERLATRVMREELENVSIKLGRPSDPSLPEKSFDRIFLVHMYHEVGDPYGFLWRLRPALRPGGKLVVVDVDRPAGGHGLPPSLLFCEFASVGYRLTEFVRKPELQSYYAQFEAAGARPAPADIKPCRISGVAPPKTNGSQG